MAGIRDWKAINECLQIITCYQCPFSEFSRDDPARFDSGKNGCPPETGRLAASLTENAMR
jgi:hypothetical protein